MNKPNPSKSQEIEILTDAIEQLGDNSYLGPWLKEIKTELEAQIRSDFHPTISLSEAATQASRIISAAAADAEKVRVYSEKAVDEQVRRLAKAREEFAATLFDVSRRAAGLANSVSVA
jgi:K+-transporting ATPase c subunit